MKSIAIKNLSILALLGIFFLLLMHFYIPNRGGTGFYLPGNMLCMIIISLTIYPLMLKIRTEFYYSTCSLWLGAGGAVLSLPIIWTSGSFLSEAFPRILGLLVAVVAYFSLLQLHINRAERNRIVVIILSACLVEAFLGVFQYFDFMKGTGYEVMNHRPFGVFQQTNVMASFMATGLALSFYMSTKCKLLPLWLKAVVSVSMTIFPFLIIVIGSRIGLLALILLSPVQWFLLWRSSRRYACTSAVLMLIGIAAACVLNFWYVSGRDISSMTTVSYRLLYWKVAFQMFLEHPWLGWGYGHFQHDFLHYFPKHQLDFPESVLLTHPHNEVLYWAVEGGLLAICGCALIIFSFVVLIRRFLRSAYVTTVLRSPLVAAVPIILHMMVEYPLYLSAPHALTLLLIMRVSDVCRRPVKINPFSCWVVSGLSTLMCSGLIFYMFNGIYAANVITRAEKNRLQDVSELSLLWHPHPWTTRANYDLHLAELLTYKHGHNAKILSDYLQWAKEELKIRPDATLYINLIKIYSFLGDKEQAYALSNEARILFPKDPRWKI